MGAAGIATDKSFTQKVDDRRALWELFLGLAQVGATIIAALLVWQISTKQFDVAIKQLQPAVSSHFHANGQSYIVKLTNTGHGTETFTARAVGLCQYTQASYATDTVAGQLARSPGTTLPAVNQLIDVPVSIKVSSAAKGDAVWARTVSRPVCPTGPAIEALQWTPVAHRVYVIAGYTDQLGSPHERLFSAIGGAADPTALEDISTVPCLRETGDLPDTRPTAGALEPFLRSLDQCSLVGPLP
jgi:hypothetical protein